MGLNMWNHWCGLFQVGSITEPKEFYIKHSLKTDIEMRRHLLYAHMHT